MHKKKLTLTSQLLIGLMATTDAVSLFLPSPRELKRRAYYGDWKNYNSWKNTIYYLQRKGLIKFEDKNNKKFIKLTKHGRLEALVAKAFAAEQKEPWDGRWRVVMFDIPEESRDKRDTLRFLLKKKGFIKLQDSVLIYPYPLNREVISYLKETKLINYIRIMKVEEMDDDKDLKKRFNLK